LAAVPLATRTSNKAATSHPQRPSSRLSPTRATHVLYPTMQVRKSSTRSDTPFAWRGKQGLHSYICYLGRCSGHEPGRVREGRGERGRRVPHVEGRSVPDLHGSYTRIIKQKRDCVAALIKVDPSAPQGQSSEAVIDYENGVSRLRDLSLQCSIPWSHASNVE
jgi:hypothetical protein